MADALWRCSETVRYLGYYRQAQPVGAIAFGGDYEVLRMSRPLRSTIQVRANERTAALDALYTEQAAKRLIDIPVRR